MRFTVAPRGIPVFPALPAPAPARSAPGLSRRDWTSPSVYEVVEAVSPDGEWVFKRQEDGSWAVEHLPTETVVKAGLRSLRACRSYAASGAAKADLERIQERTGSD